MEKWKNEDLDRNWRVYLQFFFSFIKGFIWVVICLAVKQYTFV
ncbi:hypothetical protein BVRB_1g013060 [Beta vulgaris subsp. vulgaris]|nr:hypothetical protein BVRB_1g013060 [Beta vulgaris subsp. vulgaris]